MDTEIMWRLLSPVIRLSLGCWTMAVRIVRERSDPVAQHPDDQLSIIVSSEDS